MAWLFPGQGTQYPGMGCALWEKSARARDIVAEAETLSDLPLRQIARRGPDSRLRQCDVLEPLLTAIAAGYVAWLREQGLDPDCVAGYSAGEVAALYTAGVFGLSEALHIAVLRGRILHQAAQTLSGRMVGIYRVPAAAVEEIVAALQQKGMIAVGAWNAPDHTTIVGEPALVGEAERRALALGAELSVIDIAGPWHCPLAAAAARQLAAALEAIPFQDPRLPAYTSASGRLESEPARLREGLATQVYLPVCWRAVVTDMFDQGVRQFLEAGSGRFLYSLMRRSGLDPTAYAAAFVERENGTAVPLPKIRAALARTGPQPA
jgi:[acyl-carrier-protein] S-malonyltransferase